MTSSRERQADSDMFNLAREALRKLGHGNTLIHKQTVVKLARTYILDYEMTDNEVIRAFVKRVDPNKIVEPKLVSSRQYKPDLAMQIAAQRAVSQPVIIGVNSTKGIK